MRLGQRLLAKKEFAAEANSLHSASSSSSAAATVSAAIHGIRGTIHSAKYTRFHDRSVWNASSPGVDRQLMSTEYSPEMLALLEAQRAHFASDDHIRREVEPWRDASPEERLAAAAEMCAAGDYFLSQLDPETLERVLRPVPLPDDTIQILSALRRSSR